MVQITAENIPKCVKCEVRPAMMEFNGLLICGECYHVWSQKQQKTKQDIFLKG